MEDGPVPLDSIRSEPIRLIARMAAGEGNAVVEVAEWSRATVVHMRDGLSAGLRARLRERFPDVEHYEQPGTPHDAPDEGFVKDGFGVSFPRPRR